MSIPITLHFSIEEFASHDHFPYPAEWVDERLRPLCAVLEIIRTACGDKAITILSGYRSPSHNAAIGGAVHSQHMSGRAVDLTVNGMPPSDVHAVILQLLDDKKIEIGGLGRYSEWVHLDIRPWQGHLCRWTGTKVGDEVA